MKVLTRNPQFQVKFISLEYGEIPAELVRPSVRHLTVSRRLGQATGSFTITLLPRKLATVYPNEWRDLLGPMDYVEISMWTPPRPPTVVMRGFVDVVHDSFSMAGGTPQRTVTITGRDYGKLLLLTKLYYLDAKTQQVFLFERWKEAFLKNFAFRDGQLPNPEHTPLPPDQQTDLPTWTPLDLLNNVWDAFYNPQQELVLSRYPEAPKMAFLAYEAALREAGEEELRVFAPTALPLNWAPFMDLWALMRMYQHHPWRELFVDDFTSTPVLIYRPTPWIDFHGAFVYPSYANDDVTGTFKTWEVSAGDLVQYSLTRSDEQTRNFFFTYPDRFGAYPQMMKTLGGRLEGVFSDPFRGNPYLVGNNLGDNALAKRSHFEAFGFRLDERRTPYLDFDKGMSEPQIEAHLKSVREQGRKANLEMVRAYDHAAVLEFGSIQLPGDERIHVGNYLRMRDGSYLKLGDGALYYVEGVNQTFVQGSRTDGMFVTTCEVSRGRGHLMRKQGSVVTP